MKYEKEIFMNNLSEILEKIKKFEKRIKSKIEVEVSNSWVDYSLELGAFTEFVKVTADIPEIEFVKPGYKIVAYIEKHKDIEANLVYLFDEKFHDLAESLRNEENFYCEHCHSKRRRNSVAVVYNEKTEDTLVVGSKCLKDYLKINKDPYSLFVVTERFFNDEDIWNKAPEAVYSVSDILGISYWIIKKSGYISDAKSGELYGSKFASTKNEVKSYIFSDKSRLEEEDICPKEFLKEGDKILDWLRNNKENLFNSGSSFDENVKALLTKDFVYADKIGFFPYLSFLYKKEQNKAKIAKTKADLQDNGSSEYVGNIGDKLVLKLTITKVNIFDGAFGTTYLYSFVDKTGNQFVWFSSNMYNYEPGTEVELNGRIKDHKEYKGVKQTVITRCKMKARG